MGTRKVKLGRVSDVDVRLLRIFKAVVECGGLAAAEIQLGIGRSTISTHLADLETRLGTRLCDRGRGGFSLTTNGMKVFKALLGLMHSLDDFQQEMAALHGIVSGDLNVGMVDNLVWDTDFNLSGAFAKFSELAEEVNLIVQVLSPDELEKRLIEGSIHVGITPIMHQIPALQYKTLFKETSYLYCSRGHPLFTRPDEKIDDVTLSGCSYVRKAYTVGALRRKLGAERRIARDQAIGMAGRISVRCRHTQKQIPRPRRNRVCEMPALGRQNRWRDRQVARTFIERSAGRRSRPSRDIRHRSDGGDRRNHIAPEACLGQRDRAWPRRSR
jgi:DNA-binding transcriptional LysR family regulator